MRVAGLALRCERFARGPPSRRQRAVLAGLTVIVKNAQLLVTKYSPHSLWLIFDPPYSRRRVLLALPRASTRTELG